MTVISVAAPFALFCLLAFIGCYTVLQDNRPRAGAGRKAHRPIGEENPQ